jgi:hypothetical protein
MSENGSVQTDEAGNVTISPPIATAASAGIAPGRGDDGGGDDAPEYVVYVHAGRPVLYQRYREEA